MSRGLLRIEGIFFAFEAALQWKIAIGGQHRTMARKEVDEYNLRRRLSKLVFRNIYFWIAVVKIQTYKSLKDLNLLIRKHASQVARMQEKPLSASIPNAEGLSEEELFKYSMKDVNPLCWNSVPFRGWHPVEIMNQSQPEESGVQLLLEFVQGKTSIDLEATGEYVEGAPHPKGRFLLRHLRNGHYAVEACLDLHGLNLSEARDQFESFFKDSLRRSLGCVRIVHGRGHHSKGGQPVLKENLQRWLQSRRFGRHVVAYTSAQLHDGGCGALYILLKKCR